MLYSHQMQIDLTLIIYVLAGIVVILIGWICYIHIKLRRLLAGKDAKTFSETQQFGADTFSDYKHASGKGPRMPVGTVVQVDCLAVGPEAAAPSVHGNWYHVVGPDPYTGFYIAANTFLNGDNPNTPLSQQHARDERLPLCAGSEQTA